MARCNISVSGAVRVQYEHRLHADDTLWTLVLTLVAGALLALTTGLCAFTQLEQFGPSLGSIVVFRAVAGATEWWHIDTRIAGASGRACTLSPAVMGSGGALPAR